MIPLDRPHTTGDAAYSAHQRQRFFWAIECALDMHPPWMSHHWWRHLREWLKP